MIYVLYYLLASMVIGALEVWFTWSTYFAALRDQLKRNAHAEGERILREHVVWAGALMWVSSSVFWPITYLWSPLKRMVFWLRGRG